MIGENTVTDGTHVITDASVYGAWPFSGEEGGMLVYRTDTLDPADTDAALVSPGIPGDMAANRKLRIGFNTTLAGANVTSDFGVQGSYNGTDWTLISELDADEVAELKFRLQSKLEEIEKDANDLVDMYTTTKEERRKAFETPMTPDQIAKWGEQQRLPKNVVYKMLEKYYYFDFLHKIEEIVGDDEKIDDTEMKTLLKYLEKK